MKIFKLIVYIKEQIPCIYLFTPISYLFCKIFGINIGKGCRFYNFASFSRRPKSYIKIGHGCIFRSGETKNPLGLKHCCILSTMRENALITIGNNCGFSGNAIMSASCITIEDNVNLGANATIMDGDGHWDDFRSGGISPITICDNAWIGSDSIIMKGVTIGRYSVIGAGSVVRNNVPPYSVIIGNPAKIVGFCLTPEEIIKHEKALYPEEKRLPLELLEKNYEKYFLNRIKGIKEFTRL